MKIGPAVEFPAVYIPQPGGAVLVKPGKPAPILEMISVKEAAELLGQAARSIEYQCSVGLFRTAIKPGGRPRSHWRIARDEVLERLAQPTL